MPFNTQETTMSHSKDNVIATLRCRIAFERGRHNWPAVVLLSNDLDRLEAE